MNLTTSKISILGCGWLGFPLAIHLANKGYVVKGSTRSPQKLAAFHDYKILPFFIEVNKRIKGNNIPLFFQSDILFINIPPGRKRKDVARSHPLQIAAILEHAHKYGIRKILFISSTSVYGNVNRIVTEADDLKPETSSAQALAKVEELLMEQTAIEVTILRMGGLVGLKRPAGRFLAGKTDIRNGLAPVNMVHQEDCISIITSIIEQEKWGTIYNVCSDEHPSKKDFYTHQALKQGFELPMFLEEDTFDYKEVSNYKVKKELNYRFKFPDPMGY